MKTFTSANLKTVFTYMFKDKDWQNKLLIASGLMLTSFIVPILPYLALYGYIMKIIKTVVEGDGQPSLPEWDDGGDLIRNGLKLLGELFIFRLPIMVLLILAFGFMYLPIILSELTIVNFDMGTESVWSIVYLLGTAGSFGLVSLLSFLFGFLQTVIVCHVSVNEEFSAAFRIGEWWRILRSNIGEFLLAFIFVTGISMLFYFIYQLFSWIIVLTCLLPFLLATASAYLMTVIAPLYGQVYRASLEKMEA